MIEFNGVSLSYGERTVLTEVDLALDKGAFYFLTGPSGAGKTSVIRLCHLGLRPDTGHIMLFGQSTTDLSRDRIAAMRRRIGVVDQDCRFIDHLNVAQNVTLPLLAAGRDPDEASEDLEQLLSWVSLRHVADARPPTLSGGERQRAALARATIMTPELILADEPTGNVDWEMSVVILELLIGLNQLGMTVLCATHDLTLIRQARSRIAARVLRIRNGTIDVAGADL